MKQELKNEIKRQNEHLFTGKEGQWPTSKRKSATFRNWFVTLKKLTILKRNFHTKPSNTPEVVGMMFWLTNPEKYNFSGTPKVVRMSFGLLTLKNIKPSSMSKMVRMTFWPTDLNLHKSSGTLEVIGMTLWSSNPKEYKTLRYV